MHLAPGSVEVGDDLGERVVDAALAVLARFGLAKLTLEDVAREAGCSRATLYRRFPGKSALLEAVVASETRRLHAGLAAGLTPAGTLEEALVAAADFGEREWNSHKALQFLLAYEPGVVLPSIAFNGADRLLAIVADCIAPHLARFVPMPRAVRFGEWLSRLVLSYGCTPARGSSGSAVTAVQSYVLPALPASEREVPRGS